MGHRDIWSARSAALAFQEEQEAKRKERQQREEEFQYRELEIQMNNESNQFAKEANEIAREANRTSKNTWGISVLALIASVVVPLILKYIE